MIRINEFDHASGHYKAMQHYLFTTDKGRIRARNLSIATKSLTLGN